MPAVGMVGGNAAAFSNPVAGTFGNCGGDNLRGPTQVNLDLSAIKRFPIDEGCFYSSGGNIQRPKPCGVGHSGTSKLEHYYNSGEHAPDLTGAEIRLFDKSASHKVTVPAQPTLAHLVPALFRGNSDERTGPSNSTKPAIRASVFPPYVVK
jgi:hypothetical protein